MSGQPDPDVERVMAEGRTTFLGLELLCGPGALVPRPETELVGRAAIERARGLPAGARAIDVCCGAGNLACALASHVPGLHVWATDLTDGCVAWTRRNVAHLGLDDRVTVAQGDLFGGLAGLGLEGTIDVIVCNPPYISTGRLAGDRSTLLAHEPREAFDGGPFGLTIHQRVLREAVPFLKPGGHLLFEIGLGQDRQISRLFTRAEVYEGPELLNDEAGNARVAVGRVRER